MAIIMTIIMHYYSNLHFLSHADSIYRPAIEIIVSLLQSLHDGNDYIDFIIIITTTTIIIIIIIAIDVSKPVL